MKKSTTRPVVPSIRPRLRPLLALAFVLAGRLAAADLAVVKEQTGEHYIYAMTPAGFEKLEVELPQINTVEVSGALAKVVYGRQVWLFGVADRGIVRRRIDEELGGTVNQLKLGERVALATGPAGTAIYGITEKEIAASRLQDRVSQFELAGSMVYVRTMLRSFLVAPTRKQISILDLGPQAPTRVRMGRNQVVTYWQNGTYLHAPSVEGIESVQVARQAPVDVILGGP